MKISTHLGPLSKHFTCSHTYLFNFPGHIVALSDAVAKFTVLQIKQDDHQN